MECNKSLSSRLHLTPQIDFDYRGRGGRMTELKTALVTIKKFRPISTRIPNRNGGMSVDSRLALHCESVTMIGSFDEGKWGNPTDVESDADLREWSHALTKDGGAG